MNAADTGATMSPTPIEPADAPPPAGHYAPAVVHQGVAYVSALLPKDLDGRVPDGVAAQTRQVLANLRAVLRAAGGELTTLLRVTVYLTTIDHWGELNAAYAEVLGAARPARSVLVVKEMKPGVLVSLDALAAVDGGREEAAR